MVEDLLQSALVFGEEEVLNAVAELHGAVVEHVVEVAVEVPPVFGVEGLSGHARVFVCVEFVTLDHHEDLVVGLQAGLEAFEVVDQFGVVLPRLWVFVEFLPGADEFLLGKGERKRKRELGFFLFFDVFKTLDGERVDFRCRAVFV